MKEKLWTSKYILALLILFGISMSSNIVLSALTIFAKNLTGLDVYAGMMTSAFTLAALSVRFIAGALIDKLNCKKVILTGVLLMIIAAIFFINCNQIYIALVFRAIQGFGFGIASTGASTYITKLCPPSRLLEGIGYSSIANSLTSVIGPSLSFAIIGPEYNRFKLLFISGACISIGVFLLMIICKDVDVNKKVKTNDDDVKINMKLIALPFLILFANSLTQSATTSFVGLYAISLGFAGAGSYFSVNALGMITSRFVINRLVARFGQFRIILINSLIFFISMFLLSRVTSFPQMLLLALPAGFSMGSVAPIINAFMINATPSSKSGTANAMYYSSLDIGYTIGSIVWGLIAGLVGYSGVFVMAAFIQIIAIGMCVLQIKIFKTY